MSKFFGFHVSDKANDKFTTLTGFATELQLSEYCAADYCDEYDVDLEGDANASGGEEEEEAAEGEGEAGGDGPGAGHGAANDEELGKRR